jgi:hypothetical protein
MARKKAGVKGLLILAAAVLGGAYFHEKVQPVIDKAKEALGADK